MSQSTTTMQGHNDEQTVSSDRSAEIPLSLCESDANFAPLCPRGGECNHTLPLEMHSTPKEFQSQLKYHWLGERKESSDGDRHTSYREYLKSLRQTQDEIQEKLRQGREYRRDLETQVADAEYIRAQAPLWLAKSIKKSKVLSTDLSDTEYRLDQCELLERRIDTSLENSDDKTLD